MNEVLNRSVEELELSVRSYNCLKNANIQTIGDLVQKTESEMLRTKNFGRKSLNEIKEILSGLGLALRHEVRSAGPPGRWHAAAVASPITATGQLRRGGRIIMRHRKAGLQAQDGMSAPGARCCAAW